MKKSDFLLEIEALIEDAKTAILASVDGEGRPHMRWMTPALLKDREGGIYALTSTSFDKRKQLEASQQVQWMFQSKSLDRMATVNGRVNLIENPSMRSEVLEEIGGKLGVFWKLNSDPSSLVVIETIMEEGKLFLPMKGEKRSISF